MDERRITASTAETPVDRGSAMARRGFLGVLTGVLGGLIGLVLAVPGGAYVLSPLRKRGRKEEYHTLTHLKQLEVGVPQSFAIIQERQDAWVKYPREPVGSVWLIRQQDGSDPPVIALTSECPHLGCAINLAADGQGFLCPCHTSAFDLEGKPKNPVPPRAMDRLEVELTPGDDPEIRVKFQRFRAQSEEKIPLFNQLADWLDDRTGSRARAREVLDKPIPGGARWRYVFGSALTMVFLVQAFTGILLMASYSPSSSTAWASVFYISHEVWYGWFIRGIHHFSAQAMMVLLGLHLFQVVWAGAYRRPREFTWWFGVALLFVTVGFGHTGYQLPWDQKGYWATKVVTNIIGGAPVVGPYLQKIVVGGSEFGNQTLTRFYAVHVALLPALLVILLVVHVALVRRHGVTPPAGAETRPAVPYWPEQTFRNLVFGVLVLGVVVALVLFQGGAHLDAPADPSSADYPARPEWYYLSLYQLLKYFPGNREVIGTIAIPSALLVVMLILPLLDRALPGKLAHFLACGFVFVLAGGAGFLTVQALWDDSRDPLFQAARKNADAAAAERALELAGSPEAGIPPDGAAYILRRDPWTHGRAVLERQCLICHVDGGKGAGTQSASDLAGFGSRAWIRGLLDDPQAPGYFGKVTQFDGMTEWKKSSKLKGKALEDVADFVASFATIAPDTTPDEWLNTPGVADHPGATLFQKECGTCHIIDGFTEGGMRDANLFAWGSPQWIARMIRKPNAGDRYGFLGKDQKMPAFGPDQITSNDLDMIIRYLRGDYVKTGPIPIPIVATSSATNRE